MFVGGLLQQRQPFRFRQGSNELMVLEGAIVHPDGQLILQLLIRINN